ncbi:MAG: hypothetical protein AAFO94_22875, partial [Bacteroidota bacterium]
KEIRSLLGRMRMRLRDRQIHQLMPEGFHGDQHLIRVVADLVQHGAGHFVETGTNVGSTLRYVAKTYPKLNCISCEPSKEAFAEANKNTAELKNVTIHNESSQKFLKRLASQYQQLYKERVIFWLDAHGYGFDWPLKEEIDFIMSNFTNAYILIDDFKVPHIEAFEYDVYGHYICSYDFIKDAIPAGVSHKVYYPDYEEHTSSFHPKRGWGLLVVGAPTDFLEANDKMIEAGQIVASKK